MRFVWFFALLLLVSSPLQAQDHLEVVYQRENQRLDILLEWTPGDSQPDLPPVLEFRPRAVQQPTSPTRPRRKIDPHAGDRDYTAWIASYNRRVPLVQANLISSTIVKLAGQHKIDPGLVVALVAAESAFQSDARSPVGAQGLGQLMPGTAAMLGVRDSFEPVQNLDGTVRYLSTQLRRWGTPQLALASYNAGPGAVQRYGGIPPYKETQEYVRYVLRLHRELKELHRNRSGLTQSQENRSNS